MDFFLQFYNIDENLRILLNMEMHINLEIRSQEESIILPIGLVRLWIILNDWKLFHMHVPIFAKNVEYVSNGDLYETLVNVDDEVYLIRKNYFEKDKNNGLIFFDVLQDECILRLDFNIISVKNNVCMLRFKHVFMDVISCENLKYLIKSKKEVLRHLKKSFIGDM